MELGWKLQKIPGIIFKNNLIWKPAALFSFRPALSQWEFGAVSIGFLTRVLLIARACARRAGEWTANTKRSVKQPYLLPISQTDDHINSGDSANIPNKATVISAMWVVINCENTDGGMSFLLDRGGRKRRCRGFLYYFVPSAGRGLFANTNLSFPFTSLPRADSAPLPTVCERERYVYRECRAYGGCCLQWLRSQAHRGGFGW